MNRAEALELLKEHVKTDQLLRHSFAVEASMIAYAKKYGENEERWGLLGLLHDIDFEKYPEEHPKHAPELLKGTDLDQEFIDSIVSHGYDAGVPRDLLERKALHAVDQMSSFIVAVALMRPTGLEDLKVKSVKKKIKDKAFAKAVNREELDESMASFGVELADHVDVIVEGLKNHEEFLQKQGYTLF
ncbi:MAG: HDIG domain-containing protein [Clostridiales bacterium]|nr:HDIG domain-containing protein [Clostridiales bacterium]